MSDIIGKIKSELNIGRNAWIFLAFGLLLQTLVYTMSNDSTLSFISGLLGVFAVVLCSQRKVISYVFGIAQLLTFLVIVWQNNLYAKVAENVFYLLTMVIGIVIWKNNYKEEQVQSRKISIPHLTLILAGTTLLSAGVGYILTFTNDAHPYIDAFTTIPAFVAQILMITRYREQWIFWLIIDIGSILMWIHAGDWCMVAQFVFWTANCIYGFYKWSK